MFPTDVRSSSDSSHGVAESFRKKSAPVPIRCLGHGKIEPLLFQMKGATLRVMFATREEAGQKLGLKLKREGVGGDIVLGLPRGGVIVGAEVAHVMGLPLDVTIVRKIGHPLHREFAVGALAEGDVLLLDDRVNLNSPALRADLSYIINEEKNRLAEYEQKFHRDGIPDVSGKAVLLVDDGIATGATTEAAVLSVRKRNARHIIVAVPVASTNAMERLKRVADDVRAIYVDPGFDAVGTYYDVFDQTSDEQVIGVLESRSQFH